MHIFSVEKEDSIKKMSIFWVTRPIKYVALEYSIYKFWNAKIDCKIDILDEHELKNYFKTRGIISQD